MRTNIALSEPRLGLILLKYVTNPESKSGFSGFRQLLVLAVALTLSLAACGEDIPNGRYVKSGNDAYWEFSGNKAIYYDHKSYMSKGTYEIGKDGLFLFNKEDGTIDKLLFCIDGKQLLLGNKKYVKQ